MGTRAFRREGARSGPSKNDHPFKDDYGLGVYVETETIRGEYPRKRVHHSGRIQGFNAALAYYPEDDITVAVLNNLYWGDPVFISREYAALAHR